MTELVDTLNDLINDVMVHAQSYGMSYNEAFFEKVSSILAENGDVKELTFSEFLGKIIEITQCALMVIVLMLRIVLKTKISKR